MKKIVYDLFGGGLNSVKKALSDEVYEIYTFDILKNYNDTIILDLSANDVLEKILALNLPKPDIIVASPPCQSFSRAAAMKGGNATFRVEKNEIVLREENEYINTRYSFERQHKFGLLGISCVENTLKIIDYFNPEFWYIENPKNSLMWIYINSFLTIKLKLWSGLLYFNDTRYAAYNYDYAKPTRFFSNKKLNLRQGGKAKISFEYAGSGIKRSGIPKDLILDIFKNFEKIVDN